MAITYGRRNGVNSYSRGTAASKPLATSATLCLGDQYNATDGGAGAKIWELVDIAGTRTWISISTT